MRKLILIVFLFISVFSFAQNDTTKYLRNNDYGSIFNRLKANKAFILPSDTVNNKLGIAALNGSLYIGNGTKWTVISGSGGGSTDTSSLSNRINLKLNISDTASMLTNRLRISDTASMLQRGWLSNRSKDTATALQGRIQNKVNFSDTAAMISNYLRKSDTSNMLSPYARTANIPSVSGKLNISDTSAMLSPYRRSSTAITQSEVTGLTSSLAAKINVSDSSAMLTNYLRKSDTALMLSNRLRISDTSNMLSNYRRTTTKITNSDLANSTISGVSLGSNLSNHTNGYGISGSVYNGSASQTWLVDTLNVSTKANVAALLLGELNLSDTAAMLSNRLRISDTATMLSARPLNNRFTDSLTNVQNRIQTKQPLLTLTTTGTSGAATLTGSTLNIPQYSGGGMTYPAAGIAVSTGSAWGTSITDNSSNWNSAFTQRLQWDGGSTNLVAATGRTSLGATTIGSNLFTLTNPSAITFPRFNADNSVSALDAATFLTAIGGQSALTNPVTGTGASGRIPYWNGTSTQTSSANLTYDGTNFTVTGSAAGGNFFVKNTSSTGQSIQQYSTDNVNAFYLIGIHGSAVSGSIFGVARPNTSYNLASYDFALGTYYANSLTLGTNNVARATIFSSGRMGINTTTDNGTDQLNVNGSLIATTLKGTTATISGNATVAGTLGVTGVTTLSNNLRVTNTANGSTGGFSGSAFGIRLDNGGSFGNGGSVIHGVDNTLTGSYQKLSLNGSSLELMTNYATALTIASTGAITASSSITATQFQTSTLGRINVSGSNLREQYYDGFAWYDYLSMNTSTGVATMPVSTTIGGSSGALTVPNAINAGNQINVGANAVSGANNPGISLVRAGLTNTAVLSFYTNSNSQGWDLGQQGSYGSTSDFTLRNTSGGVIPFTVSASGNNVIIGTLGTGTVYSNSGTLTNTNPSDSTLKNTIKDYGYGLNEILQLKPKTYYYNSDSSKSMLKYGFIAQEVKNVMPDAVRRLNSTDENSKLGLETDAIYVAMVNAIKELKAEIELLKSKINQ
jgi:hypothetical protein